MLQHCADELDAALRDSGGTSEPHWSERVQDYLRDARGVDDPCLTCGGLGVQTYANTSTWRRGGGGSAMRVDVCDTCWGTGDKYRIGANLRELFDKLAARDSGGRSRGGNA